MGSLGPLIKKWRKEEEEENKKKRIRETRK
jgi:hypothetical protein